MSNPSVLEHFLKGLNISILKFNIKKIDSID